MAGSPAVYSDIIAQIQTELGDPNGHVWTAADLVDYLNLANRHLSAASRIVQAEDEFTTSANNELYTQETLYGLRLLQVVVSDTFSRTIPFRGAYPYPYFQGAGGEPQRAWVSRPMWGAASPLGLARIGINPRPQDEFTMEGDGWQIQAWQEIDGTSAIPAEFAFQVKSLVKFFCYLQEEAWDRALVELADYVDVRTRMIGAANRVFGDHGA